MINERDDNVVWTIAQANEDATAENAECGVCDAVFPGMSCCKPAMRVHRLQPSQQSFHSIELI